MTLRGALLLLSSFWLCWPGTVRAQGNTAPGAQDAAPRTLRLRLHGALGAKELSEHAVTLRGASRGGYRRIVLDLDTPSGTELAAKDLETVVAALRDGPAKANAWIRSQALGAGALLALHCDAVYMAPGARIGAVLAPDSREGQIAAAKEALAAVAARRKGASPSLLKALPALADARLEMLDVAYADRAGIEATTITDAAGVKELEQRGAKILRKQPLPDRPLVLTSAQADRLGIVRATFTSFEDLVRDEFNDALETVVDAQGGAGTGPDGAVMWLVRMKAVLFVLGFLLLIIELKTPGFAVAGTLGLMLLGLAMYASWYMGLATWAEILLFFTGIGLVGVEVFLAPGMVVFAAFGVTMMVVGLILSQQPFVLPENEAESVVLRDNLLHIIYLILAVAGSAALFWKLLPKIPGLRSAVLVPPSEAEVRAAPPPDARPEDRALLGLRTVAASDLRPAGFVEIDGRRLDVASEGPFIARGETVQIVRVAGGKIVVARADGGPEVGGAGQRGAVSIGFLVFLVILGTTMLIAEVFLVSFGILFVGAAVAMLSAVVLAFMQHGPATGWAFLVTDAIVGPSALIVALRTLPRTRVGKRMILSGPEPEQVKNAATDESLARLLGKSGVALTDLRPAGYARIDGRRIDVIARGSALPKDTAVCVVAVEQNRVVVARDAAGATQNSKT